MKPLLISISVVLLASITYVTDALAGVVPKLDTVNGKMVCSATANNENKN